MFKFLTAFEKPTQSYHIVRSAPVGQLAPAVNRQPGYRREPRRASCVFELKEYVRITQVVNQGCR